MSEKKPWIVLIGLSVLIAIGASTLIYMQNRQIQDWHAEADTLRTKIAQDRATIKKTPDLVKEVIIQRETDALIKEILSDKEDVNNLARTLETFGEESGIKYSSVKPQKNTKGKRSKDDFDRVGYTLQFDANAFQLLAFLDYVESHSRFMSVTGFKLTAARKQSFEDGEELVHRVQLDLETYVYLPTGGTEEVRIDGYDHKRDLLISEISKRNADLRVPSYEYKGPRGRRDPWVDPRFPAVEDGRPVLSVEEQITMVEGLIGRADLAEDLWEKASDPDIDLITEMKTRADLEEAIAMLDEDVRRVEDGGQLIYVPARSRFENQVVRRLDEIRSGLDSTQGGIGPSVAELGESVETMKRYISSQEYEAAAEAFESMKLRLAAIPERDETRKPYLQMLNELNWLAQTVLDFEAIPLSITGVAILENERPVALINGQAVSEGELISDELFVRNITRNQIEFAYRGLVLARPFESGRYGSEPVNARTNKK